MLKYKSEVPYPGQGQADKRRLLPRVVIHQHTRPDRWAAVQQTEIVRYTDNDNHRKSRRSEKETKGRSKLCQAQTTTQGERGADQGCPMRVTVNNAY